MKKLTYFTSKKQVGMTLMELLMALAIISTVVAGALTMSSIATNSNTSTTMVKDIMAMRTVTRNVFSGQGNYGAGSLNPTLIAAKKVPSDLQVSGAVINTPLGGTLTVTGAGSNFTIALTNVPNDVCIELVTALSDGWSSVRIGTGTALTAFPVTPTIATDPANCGSSGVKTITWTTSN